MTKAALGKIKTKKNKRILMIIVIEVTPVCKVGFSQQVEVSEALAVREQRACEHKDESGFGMKTEKTVVIS